MENNNQNKDNTLNAQNTPPATGGVPLAQENSADAKPFFHPEDKIIVTPLRTYADDVKHAISDDGVSMIKIAMAEAKKQEQEAKNDEEVNPQSSKNMGIIFASFIFIALGVVGAFGVWWYVSNSKIEVALVKEDHTKTLIPYDEAFPVSVKDGERSGVIDGQSQASTKSYEKETSLVYIPVSDAGTSSTLFTTQQFFSLLQTRMSDALSRSFGKDFMFGLYRQGGVVNPFFLLKVDSLSQVYAGMLEWEPAMADDIGDIFFSKDELVEKDVVATSTVVALATSTPANLKQDLKGQAATSTASSTVATSTQTAIKLRPSRVILADSLSFRDEVVNNRDIRALRTKNGKLLMYYSFVSDNLLLIARDFNIISEVSKRLATSQFKQ